jgi:hypothetical protein
MASAKAKRRRARPTLREIQAEEGEVEVEVVEVDPTLRGFHVAWNYSTRYWLPLLGPVAWAVWQTLLNFCFGERDTCWPSISLIADIAARGNRHLVLGRWKGKGESRRRQPGALEILQEAGLLAIETQDTGSRTRYRFRVLKEPPTLTPDQLARLSPRLQQDHAELLARCGLDGQSYPQSAHILRRDGVQGIVDYVQDTGDYVQDTANKYKEERQIEELWRRIKRALKLRIISSNYDSYVADTQAISFDSGLLRVEAPSQGEADYLNKYFETVVMRTVASTHASVQGVPIVAVEFVPRQQQVWHGEDDHP